MSSTENTKQNLALAGFKEYLLQEPNTNAIKEYLQKKGLVLDSQGAKCLDDFFLEIAQLLTDDRDGGQIYGVCRLEYIIDNKLNITYLLYTYGLFLVYTPFYFTGECGGSFILDSNPVLFQKKGEPITDEVEQDKVGLAALAFQATYSKKADDNKAADGSRVELSAEEEKLFLEAESAYRRAFILASETAESVKMGFKTDPEQLYELFTNKTEGFTVERIRVAGCGFALLIHGTLPQASGENHEYYIIAIRGTTPTKLVTDKAKLPKTPGVGAEKWVYNLYNYTIGQEVVNNFELFQKINPTDVLNNILAEPVEFKTPKDPSDPEEGGINLPDIEDKDNDTTLKSFVHQGFLEKATSLYVNLRSGQRAFEDKLRGQIPKFGDGKTLDEVLQKISNNKDNTQHLIITGHSQGASSALLLSAMIRHAVQEKQIAGVTLDSLNKKMELITFGQPSVGDKTFNTNCVEYLRIDPHYKHFLREGDLVATVPGDAWAKQTLKAELFGDKLFQQTDKNPIGILKDIKKGEEIPKEILKKVYNELAEAHNAADYVFWAYYHYAPAFLTKWSKFLTYQDIP
jgi:hypothetical protein